VISNILIVPITLAITIHCVVAIISIRSVPCLFRSCWFDIVIYRSSFLIVSLTAYKCECESCYDTKDFSFHKPLFLLYNFNFIMGLSLYIILIFMITL